jgi:hypothetical protein
MIDLNSPIVSLTGLILDVLGGLYLAYDLLGGKKGPLRLLTRVVTYSVCYTIAYSTLLGLGFGLIAGAGLGLALGMELSNIGGKLKSDGFVMQAILIACRSVALALAVWLKIRSVIALVFFLTCWLALLTSWWLKFSPTDVDAKEKVGITKKKLWAASCRGFAVLVAAALAGVIGHAPPPELLYLCWVGVAVGLASGAVGIFTPLIEAWADELPPQKMGVLGTVLFLLGFCVQALPYIHTIVSTH